MVNSSVANSADLSESVPLADLDLERLLATRSSAALLPAACEAWLHRAYSRADSAATRRLVADVLDDVRAIGDIDDELTDLVIGALASVEAALDLECQEV